MGDLKTATLAGGCFWCLEAVFLGVKGVQTVESGYTGGQAANPSYQEVCRGTTGHAETVRIKFDPDMVSYADLLHIFFTIHDPTTLNRQGNDIGSQYRSAIYYHDAEQKQTAEKVMAEIAEAGIWSGPLVTELEEAGEFFVAEDYHQDYFANNPDQAYCRAVVAPKVSKFRSKFAHLMK